MNIQVNNPDKNDFWSTNLGKSSILPGPFSCGGWLIDDRDSQVYSTVQIGIQCWMGKNMNIGAMIPVNISQTNNSVFEKYCYDGNLTNCDVYGGMYQWDEAMQYVTSQGAQGICLPGWHIPSRDELAALAANLGGEGVAGGKLKEAGTSHWAPPNVGATNSSGFTGLPAGFRNDNFGGSFTRINTHTYLWSSTNTSWGPWWRWLDYNFASFYETIQGWTNGVSVRCVKD
jgi:uncharacterized protein (TIGR02145 family)